MSTVTYSSAVRARPQAMLGLLGFAAICLCTLVAIRAMSNQQTAVVALAVLALPMLFAMLVWPDIMTLAVVFVLYMNAAAVAVKFHHVPYAAAALFPLLLAAPLGHYLVLQRQRIVVTPAVPLLFLFLVIQCVGTLLSADPSLAIDRLVEFLLEGIALYLLITNVIRTPEMLRRVIWMLLLAGMMMGGLSLYQQVTGTFHDSYGGFAQMTSEGFYVEGRGVRTSAWQARLAGPIGEQNRFAQIMLMLVPLGMFLAASERRIRMRLVAWLATGLSAIGCALTFSRGAAVSFLIVLMVMALMRYLSFRWLAGLVVGAACLLLIFPQYVVRLSSLGALAGIGSPGVSQGVDGAIKGRATEMLAAVMVFLDHPVVGVGPGMFRYHVHRYTDEIALRAIEGNREAHSLYLGVAADTGAAGLFCLLAIFFVTLRDLARLRRPLSLINPELAHLLSGLFLAVVAYMATGLFLHLSYVRYLWLMLAIAGSAAYVARTVIRNRTFNNPELSSLLGRTRWEN